MKTHTILPRILQTNPGNRGIFVSLLCAILLSAPVLDAQDSLYIDPGMSGDTIEVRHRFSGIGEEYVLVMTDGMPERYGTQLSLVSAPPGNGVAPVRAAVRRSGLRGQVHRMTFKVDYSKSFIREEVISYLLEPTMGNSLPVVIRFRFSAKGRLMTYDEYRHCFVTDANIVLDRDRPFVQVAWNGFGIGKFFAYQIAGNPSGHQIALAGRELIKCNDNDLYFTPGQSVLLEASFSSNKPPAKHSTFVLKSDFHATDSLVVTVR